MLNEGAFGKLTSALTGETERADQLIGEYPYQSRHLRLAEGGADTGELAVHD